MTGCIVLYKTACFNTLISLLFQTMTSRLRRSSWREVSDRIFHGCLFTLTRPLKQTEGEWAPKLWLVTVICWVLCGKRNWMFMHLLTSRIPGLTHLSIKILHVRCVTLQELIPQQHSVHLAYGHNAFRPPRAVTKRVQIGIPPQHKPDDSTNMTVSAWCFYLCHIMWHAAQNFQMLLMGINYWHSSMHWCPE